MCRTAAGGLGTKRRSRARRGADAGVSFAAHSLAGDDHPPRGEPPGVARSSPGVKRRERGRAARAQPSRRGSTLTLGSEKCRRVFSMPYTVRRPDRHQDRHHRHPGTARAKGDLHDLAITASETGRPTTAGPRSDRSAHTVAEKARGAGFSRAPKDWNVSGVGDPIITFSRRVLFTHRIIGTRRLVEMIRARSCACSTADTAPQPPHSFANRTIGSPLSGGRPHILPTDKGAGASSPNTKVSATLIQAGSSVPPDIMRRNTSHPAAQGHGESLKAEG